MTIECKRASLFESRQLLVELQLIWSVHNNTILLIVLPLQLDGELPCRRNHLQGPLLCGITSINSINSMRSGLS